jgi:hypothetical protein
MAMDRRTIRDVAAAVAAGVGVLLLADLSVGWYGVKVAVAGVVNIKVTAGGWGQFGTIAGLLTIAMLIYMIRPMRRDGTVNLAQAAVTAVLGLGAFGFTVARALNGSASVTTMTTTVQVHSTLWPAYVGIALAAIMAGAAITALVLVMQGATTPSPVIHSAA